MKGKTSSNVRIAIKYEDGAFGNSIGKAPPCTRSLT